MQQAVQTNPANEVLMPFLSYNRSLSFNQCWLNIDAGPTLNK